MVEQIVEYFAGKALRKDLALADLDAPNGGFAPGVVWARFRQGLWSMLEGTHGRVAKL